MFYFRKNILFFGVLVLLCSGCSVAETKPENTIQEVSSEVRITRQSGLLVKEGELKESGVLYEDMPIEFQDEVVEEMLRNMIGKPEGEVYVSELQEIHAIYWRNDNYWSNLQSPEGKLPHVSGDEGPWNTKQPNCLDDLAYCYNLQWLEFGGIKVPSLKSLYNLPQLETLQFEGSEVIEDVLEEIGNFPTIKNFEIGNGDFTYWGHLTDGSFLIPLAAQLIELDAAGGIDWNPNVLAQMTELEVLTIHYADDLSFLEQMPKLKELSLYCCCPSDWSPLGSLKNLEHLEISGNYKTIIDIELNDLCLLTNLDYLELVYTSVNDEYKREEIIEALPSLTGLVMRLQ